MSPDRFAYSSQAWVLGIMPSVVVLRSEFTSSGEWKDTPLYGVALAGHLSLVKLLVNRGTEVMLKNDNGVTARDIVRGRGS